MDNCTIEVDGTMNIYSDTALILMYPEGILCKVERELKGPLIGEGMIKISWKSHAWRETYWLTPLTATFIPLDSPHSSILRFFLGTFCFDYLQRHVQYSICNSWKCDFQVMLSNNIFNRDKWKVSFLPYSIFFPMKYYAKDMSRPTAIINT